MRILLLTLQGYVRDNCALRASALTYYSLLTVVPMAAMAFGIAKGFGFEQRLENLLYLRLAGQEAIVEKIIEFARSLLKNTQGGLVAGIGVLVLFWSATKVLGHIEIALNEIWKVKTRAFIRRFTNYLTVLIISPLLVIVSSSVNVFITTEITALTDRLALLQVACPVIFFFLKLLPYGLVWLLFILIFMVMPNTQVRFKSALIAGILSGTVFQLSQGFYISAQVIVSKYNAIYGSFAALPLFLLWLQLSWMIVLFGAQITYAHQHVGHYDKGIDYQNVSAHTLKQWALGAMHIIVKKFHAGQAPPTAEGLADLLHLPFPIIERLLERLTESGIVVRVAMDHEQAYAYQPGRDIQSITIATVLEAWDNDKDDQVVQNDQRFDTIARRLEQLYADIRQSKANCLVKDL
jgi:membrane protein